jgi:site-specific DNA-methyltransferase (adenine-specific)
VAAIRARVERVRELLTDDGCMVLHVDPNTSHYLKVMCDEVFGPEAFSSEIVWRYRRWPAKTPNFQRVHDVLLRYVRDPECKPRFNQLYEPLAPSTRATWGDKKQVADYDKNGRRYRSTKSAQRSPGVPMGDVWEISVIAPIARERTGYPTQKPLALLNRIVQSCSHEGDTILDPYAGSATTLHAARRLGRRAIGVDASPEAIEVSCGRFEAAEMGYQLERVTVDR